MNKTLAHYIKVLSICLFIVIIGTVSTGCPGDGGSYDGYTSSDDYSDDYYGDDSQDPDVYNPGDYSTPDTDTGDYGTTDGISDISQSIPVITPQVNGNAELNLEGYTTEIPVSSVDGVSFSQDGVTIEVPAYAVAEDTVITFKECYETPPISAATPGDTPLPEATNISNLYDLGPNGITFDAPVTVTLPYDTTMLQPGYDPSQIMIAYYNGSDWVAAGGLVDTESGTVTASLTGFPGIVTTVVNVAVVGVVIAVSFGVAIYRYWGFTNGDPLASGKAADYVVPNNPVIAQYTPQAGLLMPAGSPSRFVTLQDPNNPGQANPAFFTTNLASKRIGFTNTPASPKALQYPNNQVKDANGKDTNWTMPDTYIQNGMVGECTCIANMYLSMFRRLGIEAYGVEGYKDNSAIGQGKEDRHAWVELCYNGIPYYYDDDEGLKPLQDVEHLLKRVGNINGDGQMWNEQGQKPYEGDWWLQVKPTAKAVSGSFEEQQSRSYGKAVMTGSGSWQVTGQGVTAKITPSDGQLPANNQIFVDAMAQVHCVINLQASVNPSTDKVDGSSEYIVYTYTFKEVVLETYPTIADSGAKSSGSVSCDFILSQGTSLRVKATIYVSITQDVYYSEGVLKGTWDLPDMYQIFEIDFYTND
jgi:hypothetical protein